MWWYPVLVLVLTSPPLFLAHGHNHKLTSTVICIPGVQAVMN